MVKVSKLLLVCQYSRDRIENYELRNIISHKKNDIERTVLSGHLEVAAGVLEEGSEAQFVELRRHLVMLLVGLLLVDGDGRLSVTMQW